MKAWQVLLISLAVIVVVVVIANVFGEPVETDNNVVETSTSEEQAVVEEQYIEITATELLKAYDENGVAADQLYKGKKLKVTGTVNHIDTDITGEAYVTLINDENEYSIISVQCYFKDANIDMITGLKSGDIVTIIGTGGGSSFNVYLEDCVIE